MKHAMLFLIAATLALCSLPGNAEAGNRGNFRFRARPVVVTRPVIVNRPFVRQNFGFGHARGFYGSNFYGGQSFFRQEVILAPQTVIETYSDPVIVTRPVLLIRGRFYR